MSEEDKTRGLYHKYDIHRTDGKDKGEGKHRGCRLFVLDYTDDPFARPALAEYAQAAKQEYPLLARDLLATLSDMGYEHKSRGRLVVSETQARAEVDKLWAAINVRGFELECAHDVLKEAQKLQDALITSIQAHDVISRDTVLASLAALCLQWFYQDSEFSEKLGDVRDRLILLMKKQGPRAFVSSHEILGILVEEIYELKEAILDMSPSVAHITGECMDIALGAIFGLVSANLGALEW